MCKISCRACRQRKVHDFCSYRISTNKGCYRYLNSLPERVESDVIRLEYQADSLDAKRAWGYWLGARPEFDLKLNRIRDKFLFATYTIADRKVSGASFNETIPPTVGSGRRAINRYAHDLFSAIPAVTKMFFVEERGSANGRLHYHGMLCLSGGVQHGTMHELCKRVGSYWRKGFFEVEEEIKPGHYLAKYITKEENDVPIMYYDFEKGIKWREAV